MKIRQMDVAHGRWQTRYVPSLFTAIVDQSMTTKPFTPTYSCRYCTIDGRGYQYPTKPLPTLTVAAEDQLINHVNCGSTYTVTV